MKLFVNGEERSFEAAPLKRLLDVLREDLGLTGTKEGCGEGECGACSVLVTYAPPFGLRPSPAEPAPPYAPPFGLRPSPAEPAPPYAPPFGLRPSPAEPAPPGELVNSCLVAVCQVEGASVLTVEGIAQGGELTTVQKCFLERGGAQCGICTPGMIVAAHCFLLSGKPATDENVREAISGNLCRCTGYAKIVEAIQLAAGSAGEARR
jgi:carbon-monoxide dehydrogenase small subunit